MQYSGAQFLLCFPQNAARSSKNIWQTFLHGITSEKKSWPVKLAKLTSRFCPTIFQSTVTFPRPGGVLITWNCRISPVVKSADYKHLMGMNFTFELKKTQTQVWNYFRSFSRNLTELFCCESSRCFTHLVIHQHRDPSSKYFLWVELQEIQDVLQKLRKQLVKWERNL